MNGHTISGAQSAGYAVGRQQNDAPPPPLAPIPSAQAQLDSEIGGLFSVISDLYDRFHPVLGPVQPTKEGGAKLTTADTTVAQKIDASARAVSDATQRLIEMRGRLEI